MTKQANEYRKMTTIELKETLTQLYAEKRKLQAIKRRDGTLAKIIPDEKKLRYDTKDANKHKQNNKNIARIKTILQQRGNNG